MIGLALILGLGVALWVLKQIVGPLIGQEVKGSIPDYTAGRARAAAQLLPPDLAAEYEEAWLAELNTVRDKPLSALRYAWGLRPAARRIAAHPRVLPATLVRYIPGMGRLLNIRDRLERVSVIALVRGVALLTLAAVVAVLGAIVLFVSVPIPRLVLFVVGLVPAVLSVLISLGSWSDKPPSGEKRGTTGGQKR